MILIDKENLDELTLGATLLGNGGGGDPYQARLMAEQTIEKNGPIEVLDLDDLPDDALLVTAAVLGAPTVIIEKIPSGQQYVYATQALGAYLGKEVGGIIPVEVGGMNTIIPLAVASELGVPCVNADGMRRAFPQVEMTTYTLAGVSASPMSLADEHGNQVTFNTVTNRIGERLVRSAAMNMGLANAHSAYPMTVAQAKEASIQGSIGYCLELGRLLRAIQRQEGGWDEFFAFTGGRTLFEGKIVDLDRRTTTGFARGTVVIEGFQDHSNVMRIEIQNELLLAIEDGKTVLTPPDLICMVDHETSEPITTEALSYGQRVRVLGLPCAPEWHREGMLEVAGPKAFGYDVDYVPFEGGTK